MIVRNDLARRESLYAEAVEKGDLRTASNVLKDLAALEGLYPPAKAVHAVAAAKVEMTPEEEQQIADWLGIPIPLRGTSALPRSPTSETPKNKDGAGVAPNPVETSAPASVAPPTTPAFDLGAAIDAIAAGLSREAAGTP
jgi:hypothetical protein